jgi:DNA-binding response OmpR family regulator
MGKRVLIVDDHLPLVKVLEAAFEQEGFSVLPALDGVECLYKVEAERPDVVVLDVTMPGMDGFEVLRTLRRRPETQYLPVVILTGRTAHGDKLAGWMGGADLYLTKPCKIEEVVAAVKRVLEPHARSASGGADGDTVESDRA